MKRVSEENEPVGRRRGEEVESNDGNPLVDGYELRTVTRTLRLNSEERRSLQKLEWPLLRILMT